MKTRFFALFVLILTTPFCLGLLPLSANIRYTVESATSSTWVATDSLGRSIAGYEQTSGIRDNRYVGLFFWNWHDYLGTETPYNNTLITNTFSTDVVKDITHPAWGPQFAVHFWDKPLYGYYKNADQWVTRRQAEVLADVGVDVIFFDCTNSDFLFEYENVFKVFQKAYDDGVDVPKISFFLSYSSGVAQNEQLNTLYNNIFSQNKYMDLWFIYKGKPLIIGPFSPESSSYLYNYFSFRQMHDTSPNGWTWTSHYPQKMAYWRDPETKVKTPEQMSVSVARNSGIYDGNSYMSNYHSSIVTRNWSPKKNQYETYDKAVCYGANFADQFEYAIESDPEFIFITGWNEWNAIRFQNQLYPLENWFCDQFNYERSRDIEFSEGYLKDHYYYQMVDYIRKFKGCDIPPVSSPPKVIDISSQEDMWTNVSPEYIAYKENTFNRDSDGYGDLHYYNTTGRNDITSAKVARDSENIYFMVETKGNLSPRSDDAWMRLLIDVNNSDKNWETFDYIVNRQSPTDMATLERSTGGWNWEIVGKIYYNINKNRLQIKIPKTMLGITGDEYTVNFKWSDNMQNDGDIMDFYINGDVAPSGRFKYQFISK